MQEERFWLLISLRLTGEASPEERDELNGMLESRPGMGLKLDILEHLWREKQGDPLANREDAFNKHLQRLSNHLSAPILKYDTEEPPVNRKAGAKRPARKYLWWISGSAAAAALITSLLFFYPGERMKKAEPVAAQNTVSTKPGSKSKIQLPDGTQVWLNADSKITYDENFHGPSREVQLTGEAYFDVVKDKAHPFIIHTHSIDLKVLGTAFNVRSYADEKNTETSLIRGSVEITLRDNPDKKIILKPNEKLMVQNDDFSVLSGKAKEEKAGSGKGNPEKAEEALMVLSKVHFEKKDSLPIETLWVKNKLAFDSESLENVAMKIERWYDVRIVINDERLKSKEYHAVFDDESLQQVMEALSSTGNFKYTINKKEVIITP
ncbi:MAG TPA: FecR domain-containing protein [Puia sp.]|jgi:ferric-dicitrate binding protein FerR (iron transport regulator)